jgi:hypothetical protein
MGVVDFGFFNQRALVFGKKTPQRRKPDARGALPESLKDDLKSFPKIAVLVIGPPFPGENPETGETVSFPVEFQGLFFDPFFMQEIPVLHCQEEQKPIEQTKKLLMKLIGYDRSTLKRFAKRIVGRMSQEPGSQPFQSLPDSFTEIVERALSRLLSLFLPVLQDRFFFTR